MTKLCLFATIMSLGLFALSSAFVTVTLPAYAVPLALAGTITAAVAALSFKRLA